MTRQSLRRSTTSGQRKDSERQKRPSIEVETKEVLRKKAGSYDAMKNSLLDGAIESSEMISPARDKTTRSLHENSKSLAWVLASVYKY